MTVVNMIGFSRKSPFEYANAAAHGEPGWYINVRPKPRADLPLRAAVSTPCARALFDSPDDARAYLEHPGDIPVLAREYLGWVQRIGECLCYGADGVTEPKCPACEAS